MASASSNQALAELSTSPDYGWIIGWVLFIIILSLMAKTTLGHMIVYYGLLLLLIFLIVTQYRFIAGALSEVGKPLSGLGTGGTKTA